MFTIVLVLLVVLGIVLIFVGEKQNEPWLNFVGKGLYCIALFALLVVFDPIAKLLK